MSHPIQLLEEVRPKVRRGRGEGRIYRRGRIWWIQYYRNGRRVFESSGSENERTALNLLRRRLGQVAAGIAPLPHAQKISYENLRDALLADYAANRRKWLRIGKGGKPYLCGLSTLNVFFKNLRAVDISADSLRAFIRDQQESGAANGTINRSLALLRRMFHLAVADGKLREVPHFPMLKEAPPRKGFLEHSDYQKLRQELPEHLRPILATGYYAGMRLGEILKLRWPSVDLVSAEIRLDPGTTKNDDPRTIPLPGELFEMLRIERARNPKSEFIFMRQGERIASFRKAWDSACVRAGLGVFICRGCHAPVNPESTCVECKKAKLRARPQYRGLIFHDLRRTGVRNLVRAGVPERVAMAISGHKTRAVFDRYNIVSTRDLKDAARKLEIYLAGENGDKTATISPSAPSTRETVKVN
jgi:integrase